MRAIVALIFLLFLLPAIAYGIAAGTVKTHRDVVKGMTKSMESMTLLPGARVLHVDVHRRVRQFEPRRADWRSRAARRCSRWACRSQVTLLGIVLISAVVNLFIGSASAKWALLAPIFVPMLMQVGISPDAAQAAYRVGDSTTNIITPLMPYFALVVVFCQRYVKGAGIGTVVALMLPYSVFFLAVWSVLLLMFIGFGWKLGVGG